MFQPDVNVVWDLAVHDLAILAYLLGEPPCSVAAQAARHLPGRPESMAFVTLAYASGTVAHINVNWLAPVKVRQTLIGGSRQMIVYNDLEPSEKIKVYDKGAHLVGDREQRDELRVGYRTGDMWAPQLGGHRGAADRDRAFRRMHRHRQPRRSPTGASGWRIVELLETATRARSARAGARSISARRGWHHDPLGRSAGAEPGAGAELESRVRARAATAGSSCSGEEVEAFEDAFAAYCGTRHAVAVNSGTSALHLALLAAGIGPGDEVITTPMTFVATVAAVLYAGARPVLVDIDPVSRTLDPRRVASALEPTTPRRSCPCICTAAWPTCEAIAAIADRHGLAVIEDAAQAHGAEHGGRRRRQHRRHGLLQLLSRQEPGGLRRGRGRRHQQRGATPTSCGCCGTGASAASTTTSSRASTTAWRALQAALLAVKLPHLEGWTEARRRHAARYTDLSPERASACPAKRRRNAPRLPRLRGRAGRP